MSAISCHGILAGADDAAQAPALSGLRKVVFAVTFACDKRCSHCAISSKPSRGSCMPPQQFARLLADLRALGSPDNVTIGFTGGEPMLYRYGPHTLASLVGRAAEARFRRIDIQTSGWGGTPKDAHYHRVFDRICNSRDGLDLTFNLSFNEYQGDGRAEERIVHTISSLWAAGFDPAVIAAVDVDTYITTYLRFYLLATSKLKATPEVNFDEVAAAWSGGVCDFAPRRFDRDGRHVILKPSVTVQAGRAVSLDHRYFISRNRCKNVVEGEHCLLFDPFGRVFVCDKPHVYEYMRSVGNVREQSTAVILRNAQFFRIALLRRLRAVTEEERMCEECRSFCRTS